MIAKLVDSGDHKAVYGILRVEDKDWATVQNEIYKIKEQFAKEGFDDWMIADVFKEFPKNWSWEFKMDSIATLIEI